MANNVVRTKFQSIGLLEKFQLTYQELRQLMIS